jgi:hypothetical protein
MKHMDGTVMAGVNYSSWPHKLLPGEDKQVLTDRAVEGVREAIKAARLRRPLLRRGRQSFRAIHHEHRR